MKEYVEVDFANEDSLNSFCADMMSEREYDTVRTAIVRHPRATWLELTKLLDEQRIATPRPELIDMIRVLWIEAPTLPNLVIFFFCIDTVLWSYAASYNRDFLR